MKVKDYFDGLAATLDDLPQNAEPWAEWAWPIVERELGGAEVLVDLGCGTGRTTERILGFAPEASILGVDFSEVMIGRAAGKAWGDARVRFELCRLDQLRLPPGSVDAMVSFGTFHHVGNKSRILSDLAVMLRPGGRLLNADLFLPGTRALRAVEEVRQRNPDAAWAYDARRVAFESRYYMCSAHPREFHTDPYQFGDLLVRAGFRAARVHFSYQPEFAIVVGDM